MVRRYTNLPDNEGDVGSVPGSGRSPGVGKGNPPQYSFFFFFFTDLINLFSIYVLYLCLIILIALYVHLLKRLQWNIL